MRVKYGRGWKGEWYGAEWMRKEKTLLYVSIRKLRVNVRKNKVMIFERK